MAKEWTDEEVKALIADSVKIVAEDREKAQYAALHSKYGQKPDDSGKTPPPEKTDDPAPGNSPKKSRSLWWGETEE